MDKETIYILLNEKKSLGEEETLTIKDIGKVICINSDLKIEIENLSIYKSQKEENWDLIDSEDVIKRILQDYPDIDIQIAGPAHILLEIKSKENSNKIFDFIKITFVCTTLFFGAALGIMYFHKDVNMSETLEKLYFTFSGEMKKNPLIMNIPYSIGLGVGMLTFFNRIISSSKRRRMEPGPMDVELYLYDSDMEDFIINELKKHKTKE